VRRGAGADTLWHPRDCRDARDGRHCAGFRASKRLQVSGPAVGREQTPASLRRAGVRGVSEVRATRARLLAGAMRVMPGREAGRLFLQGSGVLPELRRTADGGDRGALGGRGVAEGPGPMPDRSRGPTHNISPLHTRLPAQRSAQTGRLKALSVRRVERRRFVGFVSVPEVRGSLGHRRPSFHAACLMTSSRRA
jgi:hypothetical protein